jgi:tetratricopeptide (TPR) repeat protein
VLPDLAAGARSFGEIDLPTVTEALPTAAPREHHLPAAAQSHELSSPGAFGEIDLPRESISGGPRLSPPGRGSADSGDLELNEGPRSGSIRARSSGPPGVRASGASAEGGMSFGEVEFGSSGEARGDANATIGVEHSSGPVWSPPVAAAATAAAVPVAGRLPGERRRPVLGKRKPPAAKMLALALMVALVLGGASLQLTPHGAFGYQYVLDLVHAGAYASATAAAIREAQIAMGTDTYDVARGAVDRVFAAHIAAPRAKPLTVYAAVLDYETSLRFGPDTTRASRAKQLLAALPADSAARYLDVALAAQSAEAGTTDKARSLLEAASKRNPGDPIDLDIVRLRGDLELAAGDGKAALDAFKQALDLSNDARAHFGLARAYDLLGDRANTKKEIEATLAVSPAHPGALTLRAWRATAVVDPMKALADITLVLEGPVRSRASPNELSQAYAAKAWVNLERGRTNDAREAFDQAVKLNPSNVEALSGEGKLLMDDGRYAEALARFDTALQVDSTSPLAIANDAEAKLFLERLADAKLQLVAARERFPKAIAILLVLGKVEHHLGNNDAAEADLRAAISLVDPLRADAVLPYVALSELMSARGRLSDAQATLDEARKKLTPSSTLDRALGELSDLLGDSEGAMAHFKTAVERDPRDLKAHFRLATALRKARRLDAASAELDRVAAVDAEYPGLLMERGLLFEESGDIDKAIVEFKAALARAPEDPDLQLRVGAAYVVIGMPEDALPMLRKVLEKRTTSAEAHHYIGRAYMLRGGPSMADAVHYLKRAVELDPNRAEFHVYLARAANESTPAQLELARDEIDRALIIDKLNADAFWQRGVLERMEGAVDDAMKDERHALQIRPSRYEAHATLAECYEDRNDGGQALAEWARAIAGEGNALGPGGQVPHPYWRYRYGKLLMEAGKRPAALAQLLPAVTAAERIEVRPGWLAPLEFLSADALRSAGRKADAVEHYRRFLEIAPISSPDRLDAQRALEQLTGGR